MESIVLSVMHQNTGMPSHKDVLLVMLDMFGIQILMNAHVVKHPGKSLEEAVSVPHQRPNGTKQPNHAHVQSTLSETTVSHAHHQESGTLKQTHVPALHQQLNGTDQLAIVQQEDMDHHVFNAQLQDIGTLKLTNAHAPLLLFGMEKLVSALNLISFIKEDVQIAQLDTHWNKKNARNANATTRTWKF